MLDVSFPISRASSALHSFVVPLLENFRAHVVPSSVLAHGLHLMTQMDLETLAGHLLHTLARRHDARPGMLRRKVVRRDGQEPLVCHAQLDSSRYKRLVDIMLVSYECIAFTDDCLSRVHSSQAQTGSTHRSHGLGVAENRRQFPRQCLSV